MKKILFLYLLLLSCACSAQTIQYLGGPTTQIYIRGQLRIDTVIYLPLRDTTFTPSQIGGLVVKGTQPYVWIGTRWLGLSTGAPIWGQLTGLLSNQTDLQTALNAKQATMSAGYGIKLATNSILFDSANVRKVDTIYRVNDSTLRFTINSIAYNVLLRGTAAGGISSLVMTVPTALFNSPVTFSNAGGAWTGALTMPNQSANTFPAGPSSGSPGAPAFRTLVIADLPTGIPNGNLANSSLTYGVGTTGTSPNWSTTTVSLGGNTTLNIPIANGTNTGIITPGLYNFFRGKLDSVHISNDSVFNCVNGVCTLQSVIVSGGGAVNSVNGTNTTLLFSPTTGNVLGQVNQAFAFNWSGQHTYTSFAPIFSTLTTAGGLFYGNGSGQLLQTGAGTTAQLLQSNGGTAPTFFTPNASTVNGWLGYTALSNALTSAHLYVGNGSNVATDVAASGDLTLANTGAFTIGNNKVTYAKFQTSSQAALLGATAAGNFQEITLGTGLAYVGSALTATGGGSTNVNIGTGYRWAVPTTNNIKTVFAGSLLQWDSSSNANALTLKLANGTANYLIGYDGSGNPVALKPDTLKVQQLGTGDSIGYLAIDTLKLRLVRDSLAFHHVTNPDGSWTMYAASGFSDPLTTNGDIIARISGVTTRLAQGSNGTFLGVSGGALGYYTPSGTGITTLNSQTGATQTFVHNISGGTGTTFTISSSANVHNFNTPVYYDYGSRTIASSLNTFWGPGAGSTIISTGQYNTGFGGNVLGNITTGMYNTGFGMGVLNGTQRGMGNVGMGWLALALCDSCMQETAIGGGALSGDTAGLRNTAIGYGAGDFMSFGRDNFYGGNQAAQVARFSSFNVQLGSQVCAQSDGDSTTIMLGYHNNFTNHKNSKRAIHIGDLIGNTFDTHYDSTIIIGSSVTGLSSADTLLRNTTVIGNFIQTNRNNFAVFGTKSQVIQLGNGGGNTTAMNTFTQADGDIFHNTDSTSTGSGYCVWNAALSKWINLGRSATGTTVSVTNSITGDGSSGTPLKFVNDAASPGNSQYYGTNSSGTKGYFALPTTSSVALSSLTAATTTNSIANGNNLQTWNWDLLSGPALQLYSNSTAAAGNAQTMVAIQLQGANATSSQDTYGLDVQNLHSGTGAINHGIHIKTSGAGTNYSLTTEGGFTGLGTLTPTVNLHVVGAASSIIYAEEANSGGFAEISGRTHNGTGQFELYGLPSTYSGTTGGFKAATGYLRFTGASGGGISAQGGNGVLRFFTGGEALANEWMRIDSIGRVHIDTTGGLSRFNVGGSFNDNYPGARGYLTTFEKGNFRDNNSSASSTVPIIATNSFLQGNVSALQSNVTYTDAATVYIDSAIKASTNVTVTNPWALYVKTGKTHFGGALQIVDGTQSNGLVLTSDASGNGAWQAAANIYNANGTLGAARTVTQSNNALTFTGGQIALTGNMNWNPGAVIPGGRFYTAPATYTDNVTSASGTVANAYLNGFASPTFAATNASVTYTNGYNVYINGAPAAGTNVAITNAYAFGVGSGLSYFQGNVGFSAVPGSTALIYIGGPSNTNASINMAEGTSPTTPNAGDIWANSADHNINYFTNGNQYIVPKTIRGTPTLDFPSTSAGTNSDLTVTVTGAVSGDAVMLGVPNGSVTANTCYTAWVSAANTVTVRFNNYDLVGSHDPASGTFTVQIIK